MIRLRPHHLLCMLTYIGKGYSAAFTANFDRLHPRIKAGELIYITYGPEDICAPRLCHCSDDEDVHCHDTRITVRDQLAVQSLTKAGLPLNEGTIFAITPACWQRLETLFYRNEIRAACDDCQWTELCRDVITLRMANREA